MRPLLAGLVAAALVATASPAAALEPWKHEQLAAAACRAEGLELDFCRRLGREASDVDAREWKVMAAHAQRAAGEDRCAAADAAVARVHRLGAELAAELAGDRLDRPERAARALGRALHAIQDECAHRGMTNAQHAHFSVRDTCEDDDSSPDVDPAALACAEARTAEALALVAAHLAAHPAHGDDLGVACGWAGDTPNVCDQAALPGVFSVCRFLAEHRDWDGADTRWVEGAVGDALLLALADGLAGAPAPTALCGGDPAALDPLASELDPAAHETFDACARLELLCLGKVDEVPADPEPTFDDGGCAAGGGGAPGWVALAGLALVARAARRRRVAPM